MISLKFNGTKNFMQHLLVSDIFDNFLLIEGEIITFCTYHIDGFLQQEFYKSAEDTDIGSDNRPAAYTAWRHIRKFCYSIIRGKHTPLSFKFIFSLSPANIERLLSQKHLDFTPEEVQGLYLNIRFEKGVLHCITGTSLKTFSPDRSLDKCWDTMVQKFFTKHQIEFETV